MHYYNFLGIFSEKGESFCSFLLDAFEAVGGYSISVLRLIQIFPLQNVINKKFRAAIFIYVHSSDHGSQKCYMHAKNIKLSNKVFMALVV